MLRLEVRIDHKMLWFNLDSAVPWMYRIGVAQAPPMAPATPVEQPFDGREPATDEAGAVHQGNRSQLSREPRSVRIEHSPPRGPIGDGQAKRRRTWTTLRSTNRTGQEQPAGGHAGGPTRRWYPKPGLQ